MPPDLVRHVMIAATRFDLAVLASSWLPGEDLAHLAKITIRSLHLGLPPSFSCVYRSHNPGLSSQSTPSILSIRPRLVTTHPAPNHTFPKRPAASSN